MIVVDASVLAAAPGDDGTDGQRARERLAGETLAAPELVDLEVVSVWRSMVMTFVNGELQARFMARVRGLDPQRCLAVPIDVGKAIAMALVADHCGEILVAPFEFALTETGFAVLVTAIARARHERDAVVVRVGVEAAGHYHRTLVARLQAAGLEVVELDPRAVKDARGQQLLRTLKNDARDCGAMAEVNPRQRPSATMPR